MVYKTIADGADKGWPRIYQMMKKSFDYWVTSIHFTRKLTIYVYVHEYIYSYTQMYASACLFFFKKFGIYTEIIVWY